MDILARGMRFNPKFNEGVKKKFVDQEQSDNSYSKVKNKVEHISFFDNERSDKKRKRESDEDEPAVVKKVRKEEDITENPVFDEVIRTLGEDVPPPIENWEGLSEYGVKKYLLNNILGANYSAPTPVQKQVIPAMVRQRDIFVAAPTGSGKTAAYLLSILNGLGKPNHKLGVRALIVVPTRELALQVNLELKKFIKNKPFKVCSLVSLSTSAIESQRGQFKYDIMITTPAKLLNILQQYNVDSLSSVKYLVMDEADRLLEDEFLTQVDDLFDACSNPDKNIALFSATMMPEVEHLANTVLRDPVRILIGAKNAANKSVDQKLIYVGSEEGKLLGMRQLIQEGIKPPVLIFVQSKERALELFRELVYENINVDLITADRTNKQREKIIKGFKTGELWFLIATDLIGRGLDFKGISMVINYDLPVNSMTYIHRIGRTGRMGKKGKAITFFTDEDIPYLRRVVNVMKQSNQEVPAWLNNIKPADKKTERQLRKKPIERDSISGIPKKYQKNRPNKNNKKKQKRKSTTNQNKNKN